MRGYLLMGTRAQMAEAGKTTENRPLHRQNWVRIRRVTPPRKSALMFHTRLDSCQEAMVHILFKQSPRTPACNHVLSTELAVEKGDDLRRSTLVQAHH